MVIFWLQAFFTTILWSDHAIWFFKTMKKDHLTLPSLAAYTPHSSFPYYSIQQLWVQCSSEMHCTSRHRWACDFLPHLHVTVLIPCDWPSAITWKCVWSPLPRADSGKSVWSLHRTSSSCSWLLKEQEQVKVSVCCWGGRSYMTLLLFPVWTKKKGSIQTTKESCSACSCPLQAEVVNMNYSYAILHMCQIKNN